MSNELKRLISEFEKAANLFAEYRNQHTLGSNTYRAADDAFEATLALLDHMTTSTAKPQTDFT